MRKNILVASALTISLAFTINVFAAGSNNDSAMYGEDQRQAQIQVQTVNQSESEKAQIQNENNSEQQDAIATTSQIKNQERIQNEIEVQGEVGTSSQMKNREQNSEDVKSVVGTTSQKQDQEHGDQVNAEEHRSAVANFVQGLLQVADKESGIGRQVRTIAQEQNLSASTTAQALEKIQTRSKVTAFLFGSDYKNLGALRSELVQTTDRLDQLNNLMATVQNAADKTQLQNQIQALEQEQSKINVFINNQENQFSLFGWLVKMFNK